MHLVSRSIVALGLFLLSTVSFSLDTGVTGVWKTESSERGYLHVSIESCGDAVCGTIVKATNLQGESDPDHEYLGQKMIWDMVASGDYKWSSGKIWDPTKDKTYKSKMSLDKDVLNVSGCIAFFCRSQRWTRVVN